MANAVGKGCFTSVNEGVYTGDMKDEELQQIAEIIQTVRYPAVATVSEEGIPWNTPFERTYDQDLNFYLFSDKENQHSHNIRANSKVLLVIYNSTVAKGGEKGVYIEGLASEVNDPEEVVRVRRVKKGPDYNPPADEFTGEANRRMYKIVPQRIWTNEAEYKEGVFYRDYRAEVPIDQLKTLLNQ
ncbi:MAG: pyridoxamine 5-phosphate oxidase-like protein FMN-binding protein [Candidatus Saccharibacteria bacterium]|nr:pyridoxamine 5-phosphate oxidase-like protein FMN-binding protein [Candidatus Saccharibacteria bacterium]